MERQIDGTKIVGADSGNISRKNILISNEEEQVAELLREKYLEHTNAISAPVHPKDTFYTRYGKRALDIAISLPIFIILFPFNLIFGICTFFDVGRPIFYKQTRVGKDEKPFTLVKFRNMNEEKDADGKLLPPSQRVTKFGKFMRKFSLDELLNFWSVLKGDMSLIGPRPSPTFIHRRMSDRHKCRTAVRPGLECPRVIHTEGEEICMYQRTYENDIWYVENVSFLLDVKMMFLLVKMVFSIGKRTRQAEGKGVSYFIGYEEHGYAISLISYHKLYGSVNQKETEVITNTRSESIPTQKENPIDLVAAAVSDKTTAEKGNLMESVV